MKMIQINMTPIVITIMIYAIYILLKVELIFLYMIERMNIIIITIYAKKIVLLLNMILKIKNIFAVVELKMDFHLKKK